MAAQQVSGVEHRRGGKLRPGHGREGSTRGEGSSGRDLEGRDASEGRRAHQDESRDLDGRREKRGLGGEGSGQDRREESIAKLSRGGRAMLGTRIAGLSGPTHLIEQCSGEQVMARIRPRHDTQIQIMMDRARVLMSRVVLGPGLSRPGLMPQLGSAHLIWTSILLNHCSGDFDFLKKRSN